MARPHVVAQGECLSSIARAYGFKDWRVLYDHPANAELKRVRPNPNALKPGDLVAIPELIPFTVKRDTAAWHDFTVEREKPKLRVRLLDQQRQPLANKDYVFEVPGATRYGATDGDGMLTESVSPDTKTATVTVKIKDGDAERELTWRLHVGHLDPADEVTGAQGRLKNLGLYTGPIDGQLSDATLSAIGHFQALSGLEVTGMLDDETLSQLEGEHDGKK